MSAGLERQNLINRSESDHVKYLSRFEEFVRPALAEFFGVTLFVCISCLSVQLSGGGATTLVPFSGVGIALGHGLTIGLLVVALGDVSGAHLNPAVTFGALLAGAIGPLQAAIYLFAQLSGSLAGAGLTKGVLPGAVYENISGGAHNLASGVSPGQGVLCEIVLTTVLVLTVLMSAVDSRTKSPLAPLAIGFAVTVDILAGVLVTGASMNPARSFGPAVVVSSINTDVWTYHYVYWIGPALGAVVAAAWYKLFLASSENRFVFKE